MKRLTLDEAWEEGKMLEYTCQEEADLESWIEGAKEAQYRGEVFIGPPRPPEKTWEELNKEKEEEFAENSADWGPSRRKRWREEHNEDYGESQ